jgi:hypothetical protein
MQLALVGTGLGVRHWCATWHITSAFGAGHGRRSVGLLPEVDWPFAPMRRHAVERPHENARNRPGAESRANIIKLTFVSRIPGRQGQLAGASLETRSRPGAVVGRRQLAGVTITGALGNIWRRQVAGS